MIVMVKFTLKNRRCAHICIDQMSLKLLLKFCATAGQKLSYDQQNKEY